MGEHVNLSLYERRPHMFHSVVRTSKFNVELLSAAVEGRVEIINTTASRFIDQLVKPRRSLGVNRSRIQSMGEDYRQRTRYWFSSMNAVHLNPKFLHPQQVKIVDRTIRGVVAMRTVTRHHSVMK